MLTLTIQEMHDHLRGVMESFLLAGHLRPAQLSASWRAVRVGPNIGWIDGDIPEPLPLDRAVAHQHGHHGCEADPRPSWKERQEVFLRRWGWERKHPPTSTVESDLWAKSATSSEAEGRHLRCHVALLHESLRSMERRRVRSLRARAKPIDFGRFSRAMVPVVQAGEHLNETLADLSTQLKELHMAANMPPSDDGIQTGPACMQCNTRMCVLRDQTHHYTSSGMSNVYLHGIEIRNCEVCGEAEYVLPRVTLLHEMLMLEVITRVLRNKKITSEQWNFLSKDEAKMNWADNNVRGAVTFIDTDAEEIDCVWSQDTWKVW
jgi:hypothetical protein